MTDLWRLARGIDPRPSGWLPGRRYSRGIARAVSGLALAVIGSLAAWLTFVSVACWGGRPSLFDIYMCRYAYLAPGAAAVLLYAAVTTLIDALRTFPERQGRRLEQNAEGPYLNDLRAELSSTERDRHRRTVVFAFEMTSWATASLIAMLVFYFLEYSFLLGLLAIAGAVRTAVGVIRRTARDSMPTPPPQMPGSR